MILLIRIFLSKTSSTYQYWRLWISFCVSMNIQDKGIDHHDHIMDAYVWGIHFLSLKLIARKRWCILPKIQLSLTAECRKRIYRQMDLLFEHEVKHLVQKTNIDKLEFGSYVSKRSGKWAAGKWAELIDLCPYYINVLNGDQYYISVRYLSKPGTADIKKSSSYLIESDEETHQSWKFEF